MDEVQVLLRQTTETYTWVNRLVDSVETKDWDVIPQGLDTHIMWQAGHLLMSNYFFLSMQLVGHSESVQREVPLQQYWQLFAQVDPKLSVGQVKLDDVADHMNLVQQITLEVLSGLASADLDDLVLPTQFKHPFVRTKRQAVEWNNQHSMWHCGQLGMLKRALGSRFDFTQMKSD